MPTISYGSILQMTVVKMTMSFVMKINTNITPLIEGDVCPFMYAKHLEIETKYMGIILYLTIKLNWLMKFQLANELPFVA